MISRFVSSSFLRFWLGAVIALVVVMIALGGLTRLTGSGLSMVEWNPHHLLPPLSPEAWNEAFLGYQATPEYRLIHAGMDLAGFKGIFWLEYIHRLWGRAIGLVLGIPLLIFLWRRQIRTALALRLGLLFILGAAQGAVGWLMVKSGLVDQPNVSHFRLAAHFLLALLVLGGLWWTFLDLGPTREDAAALPKKGRRILMGLLGLLIATLTWGAFVAGLGAGHIHATFPLMGETWFPVDGGILRPLPLNAILTPAAVQYVHRTLAMTLVLSLSLLWGWGRNRRLGAAAGWAWVQGGLGLATLFSGVSLPFAALHQMGAVILFLLMIRAVHGAGAKDTLRYP